MRKTVQKGYLIRYTLLFALVCAGAFLPIWLRGKSLIWTTDGATQYFPFLLYGGNLLRDTVTDLFHGQLALRMYDFAIGMGDDVGAVFRSHPLDFLSAVVPGTYTELLYGFLSLFRMYLAGLSFSAFCFYWKKPESAVLMGSISYVFCGYVFIYGMRHPTFHSALIILPLLLAGAERAMRGQGGLMFAVTSALGFVSNYYFMYVCSFAMAVYVLVRFFDLYQSRRAQNFLRVGLRLVFYYLLGIGLAAAVLFPTVSRLLSSARLETAQAIDLWHYSDAWEYLDCFLDLIAPYYRSAWLTSFAVLTLPAVVVLFTGKRGQYRAQKVFVVIGAISLLIPAWGFVMSGFNSESDRWYFVLSFLLAFVCVTVAEDFFRLTRRQALALAALLAVYGAAAVCRALSQGRTGAGVFGLAELAACVLLLLFLQKKRLSQKTGSRILTAVVCASVVFNGILVYSESAGNVSAEYLDRGEGLSYYGESFYTRFTQIEDDGIYRVDSNTVYSERENASLVLGYHGISMYNSIINADLIRYLLDQESAGINAMHRVFSMDGRAASEALANVKYYMSAEDEKASVPYGFSLMDGLSYDGILMYQNDHPLAFGYTYDRYITEEDYQKLDALERQQVMLDAVVLHAAEEGTALEAVERGTDEILTEAVELPESGKNVKAVKKGYRVGKGGGSIRITCQKKAGYEMYLHLKGLYKDVAAGRVNIRTPDFLKHVMLRGENRKYTLNRRDYQVNLGYSDEDGEEEVEIEFMLPGKYRLKDLELCYVPMVHFADRIEALNEESLQEATAGVNTVSGRVSLSKGKYMVFSIPFSEGWSARVDGRRAELQKANVMYMGLELPAGEHEIVLTYRTPGLLSGVCATLLSVLVVALILWRRRGKRHIQGV